MHKNADVMTRQHGGSLLRRSAGSAGGVCVGVLPSVRCKSLHCKSLPVKFALHSGWSPEEICFACFIAHSQSSSGQDGGSKAHCARPDLPGAVAATAFPAPCATVSSLLVADERVRRRTSQVASPWPRLSESLARGTFAVEDVDRSPEHVDNVDLHGRRSLLGE